MEISGVCCQCQQEGPVVLRSAVGHDDPLGESDELKADDEAMAYVMARHMAFGRQCSGEGTTPQALVHYDPEVGAGFILYNT